MTVLIATRASIPVDGVVAALARRGVGAVVHKTDAVPASACLSLRQDGVLVLREDGQDAVFIDDLTSVWYRRMAVHPDLPPETPADVRRAVADELRAFLRGVLAASRAPVFAPKWHLDAADLRPRQLSLAQAAGLEVPRSLTTTNIGAARAFVHALGGRAVTKLYTSVPVREDAQSADVMMTTPVTSADLAAMEPAELQLCPATFQEHLDKVAEYRVTVVGPQVFVARVAAGGTAGAVDWRRAGQELGPQWTAAALPGEVTAALLRLMDRLRLDYGSADIVETTDGRFVFLEVNPAGEYLWLDHLWGDGISEALAALLTGAVASRLHGRWG
jgi:hypothetical protein